MAAIVASKVKKNRKAAGNDAAGGGQLRQRGPGSVKDDEVSLTANGDPPPVVPEPMSIEEQEKRLYYRQVT